MGQTDTDHQARDYRRRTSFLKALCLLLFGFAWLSAWAAPAPPPAVLQPALFSTAELRTMWSGEVKRCKGAVVIGIIDRHGQTVAGFGRDVKGKPVDGNTVFELASVSKVFATLLLAKAVQDRKLTLDEPVDKVVDWKVPHYHKHAMTLTDLANHTSGLAPWPSNRGETTSPYSTASLQTYLSRCSLRFCPGQDRLYSNAAFALLRDVLATQDKCTFEELVLNKICKPLGMNDTCVHSTTSMTQRLAIGHSAGGAVMRSSAPTAGGGADGLRSTVNDLLRFVGAFAGLKRTSLEPAIKLASTPRQHVDESDDIALGWYVRRDDGIIWKGGNIAGYRTYVGFMPQAQLGVVVLAGNNSFLSPQIGRYTLLEMVKRQDAIARGLPIEEAPEIEIETH